MNHRSRQFSFPIATNLTHTTLILTPIIRVNSRPFAVEPSFAGTQREPAAPMA